MSKADLLARLLRINEAAIKRRAIEYVGEVDPGHGWASVVWERAEAAYVAGWKAACAESIAYVTEKHDD
jgi:hypothetical protein